jgi:uncharacterized membrane protein required for colicin V production
MIPVEYLWGTLIFVFAMIGLVRGLWKEMGTTTILLLSLAALNLGQRIILDGMLSGSDGALFGSLSPQAVLAIYYGATIVFVAFISYQGVVLEFPVKKQKGVIKWFFGFWGGLVNGYLIVGTVWDVLDQADYFGLIDPASLSEFHQAVTKYLPVTLMNTSDFVPYLVLAFGLVLLLAIILK